MVGNASTRRGTVAACTAFAREDSAREGRSPKSLGALRPAVVLGALALATSPRAAEACSVCFGDPSSSQTASVNNAILFLLGVTFVVLASFASFFLYLRRRMRLAREGSGPAHAQSDVAVESAREPVGSAR